MIEYLSEQQVLHLHRVMISATGGSAGVRDRGLLQSAVASADIGVEEIRIWIEQRIRRE